MTKDIIFLKKGLKIENVTLKNFISLSNEEMEIIRRIRNHPEVKKWMFSDHEITENEHQKFIEYLKKDKQNLYFLVLQDNLYLGVICLNRIDFKNRHAFLGLYSNPEKKIKNAGLIIGKTLLKLAFDHLKLHTLKLEVLENNQRAINFYKKLGFKEEGRLREFVFKEDIWYDAIIMGITEKEYKENEENYKNS